jgi:hypothetical protein
MGKRLSTDSTMNHFRGHNELILQELFEVIDELSRLVLHPNMQYDTLL